MKQFLSILLCFALIATGADIDVYQSNGTKAKKTVSGGATISTGGVVTLSGVPAAFAPTAVKTSGYTAAVNDLVPCDTTSGGFTVTLPTAPADGSRIAIKMVIQGGTNVVTVTCGGSDVFNKTGGSASGTITLLSQAITLQYKASGAIWYAMDSPSLASLDLRFQSSTGTLALGGFSSITGTLANARTTATDANTASAIVARDASGNFTAGTITGALTGNATTATTATTFTARTINGVSFNGSANIVTLGLQFFGAGTDGALASGAGVTTLTRDTYYSNVTLIAGDKIVCGAFKLFISGTLDITAADANAITFSVAGGMNGGDASGGTAGAIPTTTVPTLVTLGTFTRGLAGKAGTLTTGTSGTVGGSNSPYNGGSGGASGAGGTGVGGSVAGGTTAAGGISSQPTPIYRAETNFVRGQSGYTVIGGGCAGASGGSGGGVAGGVAGGSGGSGSGGSVVAIYAAVVNRGGSTPAACISAAGGNGGAGGNGTVATDGGGGGSGGGGGGWLYMVVGSLTGSTGTNALDASGGNGGIGGNGNTTGVGGNSAAGGSGGSITLINISAGTVTKLDNTGTPGGTGNAGSGTAGGTPGGTGTSTRMSL